MTRKVLLSLFIVCLAASLNVCQAQLTFRYRSAPIESGAMKAWFYLPDAKDGYYRGTRFDWSGLIGTLEYQGHRFFSEFRTAHDPLNHDDICGTAEEYSMFQPPGFDEAKGGGTFLKIGVGLLQRGPGDTDSYSFSKRYVVERAGEWKVKNRKGSVIFQQSLRSPTGHAYNYTKTVQLDGKAGRMSIIRKLENTGSKPLKTDHYGHNFLQIDAIPTGPAYSVEFPFAPRLSPKSQTQLAVQVQGNTLVFTKTPAPDKAIWLLLEGYSSSTPNRMTLRNSQTRASVEISTDLPLSRLAFYSSGGVLCPEPFVEMDLAPGQLQKWTTIYTFSVPDRLPGR